MAIDGNCERFEKPSKVRCAASMVGGGGGGLFSKMLIKVGRCIKMLQISSASLVASSILQVANIFTLHTYLLWPPQLHSVIVLTWLGVVEVYSR